jgi:hypothetical protein
MSYPDWKIPRRIMLCYTAFSDPTPLAELERAHAYWEQHGKSDQTSLWRYKTAEVAPELPPSVLCKWVDNIAPAFDLARRCAGCNRPEHLPSREAARLGRRKRTGTFRSPYMRFESGLIDSKPMYCASCCGRIEAELMEKAQHAQQQRESQAEQRRTQQEQQREMAVDTVMQLGSVDRAAAVAYLDAAKWVIETAVGSAMVDRATGRPPLGQLLTSAWYFATPEVPGLYVLVAGPDGNMPTDPDNGWLSFTIGKHKQAVPLGGVRLRGRAGLNDWCEQHVGHHVSLPISDAVRDVAIRLLRRYGTTASTDDDFD